MDESLPYGSNRDRISPTFKIALAAIGERLRLTRLADDATQEHRDARAFCLSVIGEVYGFTYRSDWHGDLDSLLRTRADNQYSMCNRGAFWIVRSDDGTVAATIGIKRLDWQPALLAALAPRYPDHATVGSLTRAYVRRDLRGRGLGRWLSGLSEDVAGQLGYRTVYLHTNADAAAAIRFWTRQGWREFDRFGISAHFDKQLPRPNVSSYQLKSRPE